MILFELVLLLLQDLFCIVARLSEYSRIVYEKNHSSNETNAATNSEKLALAVLRPSIFFLL